MKKRESLNPNNSTFSSVKRNLNEFEFVNLPKKNTSELGKGSYGCVNLVKDKITDELQALKTVFLLYFIFNKNKIKLIEINLHSFIK